MQYCIKISISESELYYLCPVVLSKSLTVSVPHANNSEGLNFPRPEICNPNTEA